jgi:hypothetical protein
MTDDRSESETDTYSYNRRGLLALFGVGAISRIPTAAATSDRQSTEDPKQSSRSLPWKETQYPLPVTAEELGHRQYVPAGEPIHHTASWKTVGSEEAKKLKQFFRVTDITFTVAGDEIRPVEGTWEWKPIPRSATENRRHTQWVRRWRYSTPAKDPGTYDYAVEVTYNQPFISKTSEGETVRKGTETRHGTYRVGPPSSRPD